MNTSTLCIPSVVDLEKEKKLEFLNLENLQLAKRTIELKIRLDLVKSMIQDYACIDLLTSFDREIIYDRIIEYAIEERALIQNEIRDNQLCLDLANFMGKEALETIENTYKNEPILEKTYREEYDEMIRIGKESEEKIQDMISYNRILYKSAVRRSRQKYNSGVYKYLLLRKLNTCKRAINELIDEYDIIAKNIRTKRIFYDRLEQYHEKINGLLEHPRESYIASFIKINMAHLCREFDCDLDVLQGIPKFLQDYEQPVHNRSLNYEFQLKRAERLYQQIEQTSIKLEVVRSEIKSSKYTNDLYYSNN